jgi:ABC-type bacteriocin/lantibiotic exporter with double-glycine peptidase domain
MNWQWTRFQECLEDDRVVRQVHEHGCGAACAVMLLAERGIESDPLVVAAGLHLPCTARELADRLNELSTTALIWIGGQLDLDPPLERQHIEELGGRGSWAAQLIPHGYRDGHWVVIDGLTEDDMIVVRDPAGSSYRMPLAEFADLMRYMVAVFEKEEHS